jgi:DNA-binding FadR family transcriptional regulator
MNTKHRHADAAAPSGAQRAATKSAVSASAAQGAARHLRERILRVAEGRLLGSEEELMVELGVSRDTLRQAMRLLEHQGLVTIRRGVGGGFFARKPDIASVVQAAALYLRVRQATMRDVLAVERPLLLDACARAAASDDAALRTGLQDLLARVAADADWPRTMAELVAGEAEFTDWTLRLAANPVLELFLQSIHRFGLREANEALPSDPQLNAIRKNNLLRLGDAILRQEAEVAAALATRHLDQIERWLAESGGQRVFAPSPSGKATRSF